MFAIIGIVVVFGAVVGGYLMEKGNLLVLMQPAELLIIGGAGAGTLLIANPPRVLTAILKGIAGAFTGSRYTKEWYLDSLKLLYEFFDQARRGGLASLEAEVEDASNSKTLARHPDIRKDHHVCDFICDTFRATMIGGMEPFDVDQMLETDIDSHHHEGTQQISALTTVADSLPGLGIVAAVLGVVITMGALGGKPEEIGHKVAAALVGTFLGILMCYGLIGPLAACMNKTLDAEHAYYHMLRVTLSAFTKGIPPLLAVEYGRRSIPSYARPSFSEVEQTCRNRPDAQPQAA
ncbi:MAG: flagellar motor stator protein MotA [Acidobacteriia bacterium]|nr:flagellar motor stator protein MotA [Terriglobia bacterium]MBV8904267.1 flagellar motor stator protein MotA [Terriglobia bacterium]MBV9744454.1 flagellar motor stator protein MotA [Terriglobia bacterium]